MYLGLLDAVKPREASSGEPGLETRAEGGK